MDIFKFDMLFQPIRLPISFCRKKGLNNTLDISHSVVFPWPSWSNDQVHSDGSTAYAERPCKLSANIMMGWISRTWSAHVPIEGSNSQSNHKMKIKNIHPTRYKERSNKSDGFQNPYTARIFFMVQMSEKFNFKVDGFESYYTSNPYQLIGSDPPTQILTL